VKDEGLNLRAQEVLDDLCARFPMGYRPRLTWKRLRVSAGIARYAEGEIVLSSTILASAEAMEDTLVHEYGHLLAVHRHGRRAAGHGRAWKEAMRDLGASGTVRHSYSVKRNARRQEVGYLCVKCGRVLIRSRKLPRGKRYAHAGCGGPLRLSFVRAATSPTENS